MLKNKSTKNKTNKESLKKPEVFIMTQSNTEELKNARSATTGEEFATLDERIDCEVDRLNKKIEISMLQQEDKESHTIDNSVEGLTTDMIIKGRTLNNVKGIVKSIGSHWINSDNKYSLDLPSGSGQPAIIYNLTHQLKKECKYTVIINVLEYNEGHIHLSFMNKSGNAQASTIENVINSIGVKKLVFTTKSDVSADVIRILPRANVNNIYSISKDIMILEGDWTNKPIPEFFEGIKSFGQQEDKISILSSGKNLWDGTFTIGSLDTITGVESNAGENRKRSNFISIEKLNTDKITITQYDAIDPIYVHVYDENKNIIGNVYTGNLNFYPINAKLSVTLPSNAKFLRFRTENNRDLKPTSIQIEEGTQSTSYQEYISNKKDILLSQYGFDEGLRGLNNSVYDEFNDIRDVVVKRVEKYISKGNETITVHTVRNDTISFNYIFNGGTPKGKNSNPNFITNCFVTNLSCYSNDVEGCFGTPNGFYGSISKTKLESHDIDGITKYVRENFKECYYELAEPIETPLNESIALKIFNEKTYVSFENSISGTSSFKAPVNTVATIARLNRENRALEEENAKLKEDMIKQTIHFENEDKKMTDYTLDMDFKMCLMEMDIEDIKANLGGDINAKK
ncbi:TPA: hypothetical protein ACF2DE_002796 [Clostridium perfringens]